MESDPGRLFDVHAPALRRYLARHCSDPDEADDVFSETWLRVMERFRQYEGRGNIQGWLLRVCRSILVDRQRARAAELAALERLRPCPSVESSDLQDHLKQLALDDWITDRVLELAHRQRQVVAYRLKFGYNTRRTASILGCAPNTVRATLRVAKRKLRKQAAELEQLRTSLHEQDLAPPPALVSGRAALGPGFEELPGVMALSEQRPDGLAFEE